MDEPFNRGQGWNWNVENWPFLIETTYSGNPIAMLGDLYSVKWFAPAGGGLYTTLYGGLDRLTYDAGDSVFRLEDPDGTVTEFHDFTHPTRAGLFSKVTTRGGSVTEVMETSAFDIIEVQRSYTSGGSTITESYLYDFVESGELNGQIEQILIRRRVNGGAWQNVLKANYTYYGSADAYGSLKDLQTVKRYRWVDSSWTALDTNYYRYWKDGDALGAAHCLKFVVGPEAWVKLSASGDPLTATDSAVALQADMYFEFDAERRATKEVVDAGSRTTTLSYFDNPNFDPDQPLDYNFWFRRTIETLPDSTQNIVYSNAVGQAMLTIVQSGSDQWCTFTRYDDSGRDVISANPSSVLGYDESLNDLLGFDSGTTSFQYLRDNDGLIQLKEYYTSGAIGRLKAIRIVQGQFGTAITLKEYEYSSNTANSVTVYPISKEIVYPDETDPSKKYETTYSYVYFTDTNQPMFKTTTLPVVPTDQNGSGTANSFIDMYDIYGNFIWHKDERGYITAMVYDVPTGAMIQRIDDVDTSITPGVPSGWVTPSGGGLQLTSDFTNDDLGRITQSLGPSHTIDFAGTATDIRRAQWTVYQDATYEVWSAQGLQNMSDSTFFLINPVTITRTDRNGNLTDQILAPRTSPTGKLQPTDSFPQDFWLRWTTHQYSDCCKRISTRVYHTIPSSGNGSSGTNYDQTDFGYDLRDRRNRVKSPGGTITFTVFDARSLEVGLYVGTNDAGATATDPTGGGALGNNMVQVTAMEYDGGDPGFDGNLTSQTSFVDGSSSRTTTFTPDWRDRRVDTDGEIDFFQRVTYDNLNRVLKTERFDTTSGGNLIARSETKYDSLGRVYESVTYGVDPSTGTVGNGLVSKIWFDAAGNVMKSQPAGSSLFTKMTYDGVDRPTKTYVGFDLDETTYSEAGTIAGDTILEQTESTFDDASNVIEVEARQRYHNATGTGSLGTPSSAQPRARVTYTAIYPEALGRVRSTAQYGTNGGTSLTRPDTIPDSSDTVLVTTTIYGNDGDPVSVTDPAGMVTTTFRDDAGRVTIIVENSSNGTGDASNMCDASDDGAKTTSFTYTPDGNQATITAGNPTTGDQVTTYTYGTTLADSEIATSNLLRSVAYPDSTGSSDAVRFTYNRQGEKTSVIDQRQCERDFLYDALGRLIHDCASILPLHVDGSIRRLSTTYEVRGLVEKLTSYDNDAPGSGTVVNEVQFAYNDFGQAVTTYQEHAGAVNTSTSLKVEASYEDGSDNTIRPMGLVYPGSAEVTYGYGDEDSIDDASSRIATITYGEIDVAVYQYLGQGTVVEVDEPEPDIKYTLIGTAGGDDPDTGDIYRGLDRFSRIKDSYWYNDGASEDADRIQYGYDLASSRIWRKNVVAGPASLDELYTHDGLHRLKDLGRGSLTSTHEALAPVTFKQCWTLDKTGNWTGFRQDDTGDGAWDLRQERTANAVNEITDITNTAGPAWVTPAYDAAGNMTTVPIPADPTEGWSTLTADEWDAMSVDDWSELPVGESGPGTALTATYDAWNRLITLKSGLDLVQDNVYDARRYRIIRNSYVDGTLSEPRDFFYTDDWRVVEERTFSGGFPVRNYVWGVRYIDDLVVLERTSGGIARFYALQDANWNVTSICTEIGEIIERYTYTAYGEPEFWDADFEPRAASAHEWDVLYAGYRSDNVTGLYAVRNRYHHSRLGDWLTRDPLESDAATPNTYEYCASQPLSRIDPYGLEDFEPNYDALPGGWWNPLNYPSKLFVGLGGASATRFACDSWYGNYRDETTITGKQKELEAKLQQRNDRATDDLRRSLKQQTERPIGASYNNLIKESEIAAAGTYGGNVPGVAASISSRAARRSAMRAAKMPTSQQPLSGSEMVGPRNTSQGRSLEYSLPTSGGGTQRYGVQQTAEPAITKMSAEEVAKNPHLPHWEAGPVKPGGQVDALGRPRLQSGKAKCEYGPQAPGMQNGGG